MSKKSKRVVKPFTNKFGDVINPGEQVYAITTCSHRTEIGKAEYLGVIERQSYNWQTKQTEMMPYVQLRRPSKRSIWFDTAKNKVYDWVGHNSEYFKANVVHKTEDVTIITTLQYNNIIPATSSADRLVEAV